jgi:hypothetical protein
MQLNIEFINSSSCEPILEGLQLIRVFMDAHYIPHYDQPLKEFTGGYTLWISDCNFAAIVLTYNCFFDPETEDQIINSSSLIQHLIYNHAGNDIHDIDIINPPGESFRLIQRLTQLKSIQAIPIKRLLE